MTLFKKKPKRIKHDIDNLSVTECREIWNELDINQQLIVTNRVIDALEKFNKGMKDAFGY